MSRFYKGQRVRYVSHDADDKFYPPKGTLGTITIACGNLLSVEWDNGTFPGSWICYTYDVIPAKEDNNDNDA